MDIEFENKKKEQLDSLSEQIRNNSTINKNQFHVYPIEASLGKTNTMIRTINKMKELNIKTKILIVSKYINEGFILQERIKSAIAINSNNKIDENELKKYDVIIITHQLYKLLCKNSTRRKKYIEGRDTLIIDEELDLLKMFVLNDIEIVEMYIILKELTIRYIGRDDYINGLFDEFKRCFLQDLYNNIISRLVEEKNKYTNKKMKFLYIEDDDIDNKINELKYYIECCQITKEYFDYLYEYHNIETSKQSIISRISMLRNFFNNKNVIVSGRTLYTYDDSIKYFMLKNNIILDASSKFNAIYKISPLFVIKDTDRIINHSNTTIHICLQNSTAYAKRHNSGLLNNMFMTVLHKLNKGDKALILSLKRDIDKISKEYKEEIDELNTKGIKLYMENFQAMRGKNDWKDCNKCFVLHNPQKGFPYYVFMYKFYGEDLKELTDEDLIIGNVGKNNGFVNNEVLEDLRITDIVSSIYQGIKRINRDNQKKADMYIMNSSERVLKLLVKQLNDANFSKFKLVLHVNKKRKKRVQKKYNNLNRNKEVEKNISNKANKLIDYFNNLKVGEYKKKEARESIGIINRKEFNNTLKWIMNNGVDIKKIGIIWDKNKQSFLKTDVIK